jgi:hypothetical protein
MPAPAREENLFDYRNFLESPYEYSFKGDPRPPEVLYTRLLSRTAITEGA